MPQVSVVQSLFGGYSEEAVPEHGHYSFRLMYLLPDGRNEMRARVSDDADCLLVAAAPIDPFDGVEVSTRDKLGSVHHF